MTGFSFLLWGIVVMFLAIVTVCRIIKAVRRRCRHHRCANKRFMRGYRAGYRAAISQVRRTTLEATAPPMVRRGTPVGAGVPTSRVCLHHSEFTWWRAS